MRASAVITSTMLALSLLRRRSTTTVCMDGTLSRATGRGTCSWHGGVR
jgi:hypothetical protein